MTLIAADCAPVQPSPPLHVSAGAGVCQMRSPLLMPMACRPPASATDDVRHRHVHHALVGGRSPLDAAERAALAGAILPDHRALLVGVHSVGDAGLLPDDDDAAAVRKAPQDRRVPEIEVRPDIVRAVVVVGPAADHERIARRHLRHPLDGAGIERQGDHGIARRRRRVRVGVAGRGIQELARDIHGGRGPDRGAGRLPERRARGVLADHLRRLGNHVRLPDLLAGARVDGDDAAAEGAAGVVGACARQFFERRHRHVEPAVDERRRRR